MVEEKDDLAKFADYKVSSVPPPPPPQKEEDSPPPPAQPKPAAASPPPPPPPPSFKSGGSSPEGGRIFASPAAKKLAEDNKVRHTLYTYFLNSSVSATTTQILLHSATHSAKHFATHSGHILSNSGYILPNSATFCLNLPSLKSVQNKSNPEVSGTLC